MYREETSLGTCSEDGLDTVFAFEVDDSTECLG